jgi:hypothetical protein
VRDKNQRPVLDEGWILRVGHKLLWRDTHMRVTPSSIARCLRTRATLFVDENQKMPMK